MFNDMQKKEYAAIQAPSHLKTRITRSLERPRIQPRVYASIAACIALIMVISLFSFQRFSPKKIALSYLGNSIDEQGISVLGNAEEAVAFGAKTIVPSGIPLRADAKKDTKISVSGGKIQIFNQEDELLAVGTDLTLDGPAEIRWDISDLPTGRYTLTLADQTYEIQIDAENGEMKIFKK